MPSQESQVARRRFNKETVDPDRSLDDERQAWEQYAAKLPIADGMCIQEEVLGGVRCLWLCPKDRNPVATIVYAHGGGLTTGSILTHRSFCSNLAVATNCDVLLVEYRLLPEAPAAAPSDDFLAVLSNLHQSRHHADRPVFLMGDSSGGSLAIGAMARLRDSSELVPAGCVVFSGAFDATLSSESITVLDQADPILSEAALRHWQTHFDEDFDFANPLVSSMFTDLSALPPVLLLVGEDEVWLDDTKRMHANLIREGTPSDLHIYEGMWHVWPMTRGLPETEDALNKVSEFIDRRVRQATVSV